MIKIVYILGAGHCGSTLLDMLLNGHSRIQGLGEAGRKTNPPSLLQMIGIRLGTNKNPRQVHYAANHLKYISCIGRITGKDVLVDSSKFWQRLLLLSAASPHLKVIHLVRDGRAVLHSYDKKYHRFFYGWVRWFSPTFMAIPLRLKFSRENWLRIHYEELAENPEETLKKICQFIGVEFEPGMLRFREHLYTGQGGNRMKREDDPAITPDDSWRRQLPSHKKLLFCLLGGWLNRYYGYPFI